MSRQGGAERVQVRSPGPGHPDHPTGARAAASADAPDEADLLARVGRGDTAAYRLLVARHLPTTIAVARRMLRDDAEAEDMAQEALLRLWRNAQSLEIGPGGLKPWLRRVTSNLCIDRIRSARNTTVTDEVPEQIEAANQIETLQAKHVSRRVDAALKALPDRQRMALVLFHFEGLSQIEVGEALGISDEAVESLLARARRALKLDLRDEWRELMPHRDG